MFNQPGNNSILRRTTPRRFITIGEAISRPAVFGSPLLQIAPLPATQEILPPSNAGPAAVEVDTIRSRFPIAISPFLAKIHQQRCLLIGIKLAVVKTGDDITSHVGGYSGSRITSRVTVIIFQHLVKRLFSIRLISTGVNGKYTQPFAGVSQQQVSYRRISRRSQSGQSDRPDARLFPQASVSRSCDPLLNALTKALPFSVTGCLYPGDKHPLRNAAVCSASQRN